MPMNPRLLRPLATGFSPRQISGLVAWWDAQVATSYDIATGVSEWRDLSGNGNALAQATPNNQPTLSTINGKTAFEFDGSNDEMQAVSSVLPGITQASQFSFFGVTQGRLGQLGYVVTNGASGPLGAGIYSSASDYNLYYGTSVSSPAVTASRDATAAQVWGLTHNNQVAQIGVNGTLQSAVSITSTFGAPTSSMTVGNRPGGSSGATFFDGEIGSLLIYNRALTTAERQKIEGYLAWKWGLQAQLPYDHPYAASFPGYGSQATPTDADTLTYLAAVAAADGTGVEVGVANAVDDFIQGTKADGTWDSIKASCILAGARTLAGALVPLKGAAPTNNNFADADYNRETGLVGDGSTTYLDSNRNNNADPQDSSHIAVYASSLDTDGAVVGVHMGAGGSGVTGSTMLVEQGALVLRVRSRSSTLTSSSQDEAVGFMAVARPDASNISVRSDGGTSSHAVASETPANANYFVFGTNNSGLANATDARLAFYSIGESLDLAALDARVTALITAIGAAI